MRSNSDSGESPRIACRLRWLRSRRIRKNAPSVANMARQIVALSIARLTVALVRASMSSLNSLIGRMISSLALM